MSDNNPYDPPESPIGDRNSNFGDEHRSQRSRLPASRSNRLLAAMLDSLATILVVLPIMNHLGLFSRPTAIETQVTAFLLGFLSVIFISGYLLHTRGQSIGKAIVGIQIVGIDGQQVPLSRIIFMRYLPVQLVQQIPALGSILLLMDVLWIFKDDSRCIHDHIAQTIVVDYVPFD